MALWERIKSAWLRQGLGVVGINDVLLHASQGRIQVAIMERGFKQSGVRCRGCEHLQIESGDCTKCGSSDGFEVDLGNELVELLEQAGSEIDFSEPIAELTESGGVAALLRY